MPVSSQKARIARAALAACVAALMTVAALAALPAQALADDDLLPAPTKVKAKATKKCGAKVSWSKVPDAAGYSIYWSTSKNKGYKAVGFVFGDKSTFTHAEAVAGAKNYYKVSSYNGNFEEGPLSKAGAAKVGSTFTNSFVKFTIPKYWRGKVYITERSYGNQAKDIYICDAKSGAHIAEVRWDRRANDNEGDASFHRITHLKRGKGSVEVWVKSWALARYYDSNPLLDPFDDESSRRLTKAETNRLIKLQTGGKLSYNKVKRVSDRKVLKYVEVSDKYIAKKLKVKVVK